MPSFATPAARTACAVRAEAPAPDEAGTFSQAPGSKPPVEHYTLVWRGIEVRIVYDRASIALVECPYSHLEVMTARPRQPLPMSETGYKSLFLPGGTIEENGGPVPFVERWLDHAAKTAAWKATERDMRQGSLF